MSLSPGVRVGAYHVTGPLGAGGMGEVFRAHDSRLKRDVALKVLAAAAVSDPDRQARFEREAQLLAALNHPNIAHVHGVEDVAGQPVIVMELVEGPTLADRLQAGALDVADALAVALQICDGLEAAHEAGIVHRDLKPANIKVSAEGAVKLLDFGLARALTGDTAPDAAHSPTMLGAHTEAGVVLGTAAYMSPEQARGRVVDKRADIWAFGCVLYEMLTGSPAFPGETATDILAAVIQQEPDWSRLPAHLPERAREVVYRCLEKNARQRQRDIADARFEIARARESRGSGPTPARSAVALGDPGPAAVLPPSGPVPISPAVAPARWGLAVAGLAVGAVLAAAVTRGLGTTPAPPVVSPTRVSISLPPPLTMALGRGSSVTLSPDGRTLVFAGRDSDVTRLYLRRFDAFTIAPLPGTEGATNPFFSYDGRWVAFFADRKLKKVALEGGAPVTLGDAANPRGHAWGDDDTILYSDTNGAGISRIPAAGGAPTLVTTLQPGELSHRWPTLLPGGAVALFSIWNDTGWEPARIVAQRLATGERTPVVDAGGGYGRVVRDGADRSYLVFARSEGLLAARFDQTTLKLTGQAVPVADAIVTNLSGGAHFDIAAGTLAYVPGGNDETNRDLTWVTLDGRPQRSITIHQMGREWALSPDGERVVRTNPTGANRNIWVEDLARGTTTQLTTSAEHFRPIWSRDGRTVYFTRGAPVGHLFSRDVASGEEQQLTFGATPQYATDVAPDGTTLLYSNIDPATGTDLWLLPLTAPEDGSAKAPARPIVALPFNEVEASFSPDGTRIAYQSNATGRYEVFVKLLPDGAPVQISTGGGISARWAPNGREVFYRATGDNRLLAAGVDATGTPTAPPRTLFNASAYETGYAITPDGQRVLMMPLLAAERAATTIDIVFDFLQELRQRVR